MGGESWDVSRGDRVELGKVEEVGCGEILGIKAKRLRFVHKEEQGECV